VNGKECLSENTASAAIPVRIGKISRALNENLCHNGRMGGKQKWLWEIYFMITLSSAVLNAYHFFRPDSPIQLYYAILRSFDPVYHAAYWANAALIVLNIIHCLPLLFYIYRVDWLKPWVWRSLLILRCLFELTGHAYEFKVLGALHHNNMTMFYLALLVMFGPIIPSYCACFQYAFYSRNRWL